MEDQGRLPDILQIAGNDLRYDDVLIERRSHATTNFFELRNNVLPRKHPKVVSFPAKKKDTQSHEQYCLGVPSYATKLKKLVVK